MARRLISRRLSSTTSFPHAPVAATELLRSARRPPSSDGSPSSDESAMRHRRRSSGGDRCRPTSSRPGEERRIRPGGIQIASEECSPSSQIMDILGGGTSTPTATPRQNRATTARRLTWTRRAPSAPHGGSAMDWSFTPPWEMMVRGPAMAREASTFSPPSPAALAAPVRRPWGGSKPYSSFLAPTPACSSVRACVPNQRSLLKVQVPRALGSRS